MGWLKEKSLISKNNGFGLTALARFVQQGSAQRL